MLPLFTYHVDQVIERFGAIGRKASELETHMVSLERVQEYSKTPTEVSTAYSYYEI